jgi:hypothetical protein
MAFHRPNSMLRGETRIVTLLVSQALSVPVLKEQIHAKGDVVEGNRVRSAPMMQAHLTGGAFDIAAVTAETQPISATETTEWKWEIKPKEFGKLPLNLAVNAVLKLDGDERTRTLRTFEETVEVTVSWSQSALAFLDAHVEWIVEGLLTAVFIPIAGWLWKHWRKRRLLPAVAKRPHGRMPPA